MEKAKLMQLEIEEKRKLPKNVKDEIVVKIFHTLIVAIIIIIYFLTVNLFFYNFEAKMFEECMKYYALIIIIATVTVFEIGYRKNSMKFAVIGVELLACGILSLYIPYILLHTTKMLRLSIMILPIPIVIYYALKSFVIFKGDQIHYQSNLSDVKELVKDTEKRSYLEEDSTKSYRAKMKEEEEIRKVINSEQKLRRQKQQMELKKQALAQKNKKVNTKNKKKKQKNKI